MIEYNHKIPGELLDKLWEYGMYSKEENTENKLPTYGEVFDWFAERSIIITMRPFITFAFANHIGYTWEITYPNLREGRLERLTEDDVYKYGDAYGGSFCLEANQAIKYAMTVKPIPNE